VGEVLRRVTLILLAASAVATAAADDRVPLPNPPSARGKVSAAQGCVEPTEVMRKNHMKFLLHQRDETVHEGIRTKKYNLVECINCHSSDDRNGKPIAVNAPGQFCQSCHAYAGVHMDCFQCHATTPATP
jgi:[DsrC]-trisulfide reductase subunit J